MRAGQIWGYHNPETGVKSGWRVEHVFPKGMGYNVRTIAHLTNVKTGQHGTLILTEDALLPMLKDGTASRNWRLIEDVP